jgi:hypothetical protein
MLMVRRRRRSAARKLLGKGVLLAMLLPRLLALGMLRSSSSMVWWVRWWAWDGRSNRNTMWERVGWGERGRGTWILTWSAFSLVH